MGHFASLHFTPFKRCFSWQVTLGVSQTEDRSRNVKSNLARRLIVVFLGPLAIPLAFLVKSENSTDKN